MPEITELQSKIIDMVLEGYEKTKIAKELNIARSWLYKILDKPEVKAEMEARRAQLRKAANDKITGKVGSLAEEMLDLALNATDQRVKMQAIKYLLDRALGTPTIAKEDENNSGNKDDKNKNDLKNDLEEIKKLTVVK